MADSGGRVEFTGMHVVLPVGKKPRHGKTQLGGAYEIANSAAVRRHPLSTVAGQLLSCPIMDDTLFFEIND